MAMEAIIEQENKGNSEINANQNKARQMIESRNDPKLIDFVLLSPTNQSLETMTKKVVGRATTCHRSA